jgi:hypothetical protein
MKRTIAALIAGLVLGISGTAVAATAVYWEKNGNGYRCQGISSGVTCNAGYYQIGVTRDYVYVQRRSTEQTFGCRKYGSWTTCVGD